ncbi:ATP-binding protein [Streptomyces meridianus]|uniref:ATP-binding protein n=1 Tax=Streptomyces meridianus TaxID=2938945 RepID=A0ABT0X520_9ACTN|nr:ATP-binding protein [Streptomyces meridianus]MCM2577633.1 ATP-binding protein [Streptomyces meridianus]
MPANTPATSSVAIGATASAAPPAGGLPRDIEWRLPRHPRSVGRARALLRAQAGSWRVPPEPTEIAVLLLSELATNAVRHADGPDARELSIRLTAGEKRLRVEVSDASERPLRPAQASACDETGRGLSIVAALADDWGTHPRACGIGKIVWFEIAAPAERAPAPVGESEQ